MAKSALRRHHRARVIARRRFIIRNVWYTWRGASLESFPFDDRPGFLGKYNLVCSCGICRRPKWRDERHAQAWRWDDVAE